MRQPGRQRHDRDLRVDAERAGDGAPSATCTPRDPVQREVAVDDAARRVAVGARRAERVEAPSASGRAARRSRSRSGAESPSRSSGTRATGRTTRRAPAAHISSARRSRPGVEGRACRGAEVVADDGAAEHARDPPARAVADHQPALGDVAVAEHQLAQRVAGERRRQREVVGRPGDPLEHEALARRTRRRSRTAARRGSCRPASSNTPQTAVAGCTVRCRPSCARAPSPLRASSSGVWIAPAATTTVSASTVSRPASTRTARSPRSAATPTARPSRTRIRSARASGDHRRSGLERAREVDLADVLLGARRAAEGAHARAAAAAGVAAQVAARPAEPLGAAADRRPRCGRRAPAGTSATPSASSTRSNTASVRPSIPCSSRQRASTRRRRPEARARVHERRAAGTAPEREHQRRPPDRDDLAAVAVQPRQRVARARRSRPRAPRARPPRAPRRRSPPSASSAAATAPPAPLPITHTSARRSPAADLAPVARAHGLGHRRGAACTGLAHASRAAVVAERAQHAGVAVVAHRGGRRAGPRRAGSGRARRSSASRPARPRRAEARGARARAGPRAGRRAVGLRRVRQPARERRRPRPCRATGGSGGSGAATASTSAATARASRRRTSSEPLEPGGLLRGGELAARRRGAPRRRRPPPPRRPRRTGRRAPRGRARARGSRRAGAK